MHILSDSVLANLFSPSAEFRASQASTGPVNGCNTVYPIVLYHYFSAMIVKTQKNAVDCINKLLHVLCNYMMEGFSLS